MRATFPAHLILLDFIIEVTLVRYLHNKRQETVLIRRRTGKLHMNTRRKRWTDMAYLNQMNFAYFFRTHRGALRRTIENEMRITYWGMMFKLQT
jgi:hypothetical protein